MTKSPFAVKIATALCIALLACGLPASSSRAQDANAMVGAWYGELAVAETKNGRPVNFRRWLRINRPDGTQVITFHFYLDGTLQADQVWNGVWRYENGLYMTECRTLSSGGRSRPCADRRAYRIERIDSTEMVYTNRATGERFTVKRVPDDFRLP